MATIDKAATHALASAARQKRGRRRRSFEHKAQVSWTSAESFPSQGRPRRRSPASFANTEPQHLPPDADARSGRADPARRHLPHRLRGSRLPHGVGGLRRKRRGQDGAPRRLGRIRDGYVERAAVTWADTERGCGPIGTAIRTARTVCLQDYATDPQGAPWRAEALRRGYRSGIALPLKNENATVFG